MPDAPDAASGPPVRDAASVVLLRRDGPAPQVLMGRRPSASVFMPDMFVFPGGAVEAADLALAGDHAAAPDHARLALDADPAVARALPYAAIRELWEETGLFLARPDPASPARVADAPPAWAGFLEAGLAPRPEALSFVFRAVTPPGRPRRFDARFFLARAEDLASGPMDFVHVDHELADLRWIELAAARDLPLPFITTVVLAEIEARLAHPDTPRPAPFFHHDARGSHVRMI